MLKFESILNKKWLMAFINKFKERKKNYNFLSDGMLKFYRKIVFIDCIWSLERQTNLNANTYVEFE